MLAAVGALFVLCLGSVGLLIPGIPAPSLLAPTSIVIVLPLFLSRVVGMAAFIFWPLAPLLWTPALWRGSAVPPYRTFLLWGAVFALSLLYFGASWRFGIEYQGGAFTWGCLGLSVGLGCGVGLLALSCLRKPSFARNLTAHWLLFAWVVTYAFPYLGELP